MSRYGPSILCVLQPSAMYTSAKCVLLDLHWRAKATSMFSLATHTEQAGIVAGAKRALEG